MHIPGSTGLYGAREPLLMSLGDFNVGNQQVTFCYIVKQVV